MIIKINWIRKKVLDVIGLSSVIFPTYINKDHSFEDLWVSNKYINLYLKALNEPKRSNSKYF